MENQNFPEPTWARVQRASLPPGPRMSSQGRLRLLDDITQTEGAECLSVTLRSPFTPIWDYITISQVASR